MEEKITVIWSSNASDMMEEIHDYISQFSFKAADKYIEGIYNSVARLEAHRTTAITRFCTRKRKREKK